MTSNFGQNGVPHITYYDEASALSFVYDDAHSNKVAVSHGGYAEGVIDTFKIEFSITDRLGEFLNAFRIACQTYVAGWEQRRVKAIEWGESQPTPEEDEAPF